ncbi:aminomethyl-transferring glycine dehydrogenase, partial [Aegicerativicinus sediminis]
MNTNAFSYRHIGPREEDQKAMLDTLGIDSIEDLIYQTIPDGIRLEKPLDLDEPMNEYEYMTHIHELSKKNKVFKSYIGLGYHPTIMPAVIQRNILENPGWYTAYTPYQAEIAQGRLEALLNFQTMITDLTGMEIANASLLDEGTAAAEAMSLLFAVRDREQKKAEIVKFFVSDLVLPQTIDVLKTRALPIGIDLVIGDENTFEFGSDYFGALLQYPGKNGVITDIKSFIEKATEANIKTAVAADIMSLLLLEAPGKFGADVVVGTTQRFGIPMGYGGPHAAYFATKETYKRELPGRIIGVTKDADGNRALRMALQTREQHIKRDRATSNICTAQVLLAVMAGMYSVYHGPIGLKNIAESINLRARKLAEGLSILGVKVSSHNYFDTLEVTIDSQKLKPIAEKAEVNLFYADPSTAYISINETTSDKDLNDLLSIFETYIESSDSKIELNSNPSNSIPNFANRKTEYLQEEVFNRYHSETEMMRYIKSLERKDLSLNHSMISLGSCTMKLNAASEMLPLSWPNWGTMHPFAPIEQAEGYQIVLKSLEDYLTEITGFAATSLQPNSGAQGEYAGLMVIKAYHESRGEGHRNICLIPSSAHGTNPASAVMAGMKVVVTKSTEHGNIDVEDLKQKAEQHKDNLAALMVTYPSTHGVYESAIKEITKIIHDNG